MPHGLHLLSREHRHPFGVWAELSDLSSRIAITTEHCIQVRAALGQCGIRDDSPWIVRASRPGEEPAIEHGSCAWGKPPQSFGRLAVLNRGSRRGEPGADQASDTSRRIEPGIEEARDRQPGLFAKGRRAALPEVGGRACGNQIVGEVDESPQAFQPAGQRRQVPFTGQEPGKRILFGVGADR